jgi:hypothetical protein
MFEVNPDMVCSTLRGRDNSHDNAGIGCRHCYDSIKTADQDRFDEATPGGLFHSFFDRTRQREREKVDSVPDEAVASS